MAADPKVRPSLSINHVKLIVSACEYKIAAHMKAGSHSLELLELIKAKTYMETFIVSSESPQQQLARLLAANPGLIPGVTTPVTVPSDPTLELAEQEKIALTDEQRYDLLKLRDSTTYTEEEKAFFLNTGTMIEIRRASKQPVNASDL